MNPFLIILGSIAPLIIMLALIWNIIGPDRNKKEWVTDIYGYPYLVPSGSTAFLPLIIIAIVTYHLIKAAVRGNTLGQLFVFASITLTSLCFLRFVYVLVKRRLKKRFEDETL